MLIVWDRLFGTFAEEKAGTAIEYGLVHQIATLNPLKIVVSEWVSLLRDLRSARDLREAIVYAFGKPGWGPERRTGSARVAPKNAAEAPEPLHG